MISIIVAVDSNYGIGKDNKLPWKIKEDLKHFSQTTKGEGNNVIVMGRKTWESIGSKPLPGRINIVISSKTCGNYSSINKDGAIFFKQILSAIIYCSSMKFDKIFIIGGEQIYKEIINEKYIDYCIISRINKSYECDKFFPNISKFNNWKHIESKKLETKEEDLEINIETWKNTV